MTSDRLMAIGMTFMSIGLPFLFIAIVWELWKK